MTPTHSAALAVIRESLAFLRDTFVDLPAEAIDWRPWEGANPIAVLVLHAVTSLEFFVAAATGEVRSFEQYRQNERARAFSAAGISPDSLRTTIDAVERDIATRFATASEEHLRTIVSLPGSPADGATGTEALFRAAAHLREHVGHAQAVHDLWLARGA